MIERNHVLVLNWHFDVAARRTALPAGFHLRLAEISQHVGALSATEWRAQSRRRAAGRGRLADEGMPARAPTER
jgi:hypothetical protein